MIERRKKVLSIRGSPSYSQLAKFPFYDNGIIYGSCEVLLPRERQTMYHIHLACIESIASIYNVPDSIQVNIQTYATLLYSEITEVDIDF